jgi:hypothetical protein
VTSLPPPHLQISIVGFLEYTPVRNPLLREGSFQVTSLVGDGL